MFGQHSLAGVCDAMAMRSSVAVTDTLTCEATMNRYRMVAWRYWSARYVIRQTVDCARCPPPYFATSLATRLTPAS